MKKRVLVHIITAKAVIFSSMTKAIISAFAMKTCTELSTELVRHSIGSRVLLPEDHFQCPVVLEQITYWRTADKGHDRTLMKQEGTCLAHGT